VDGTEDYYNEIATSPKEGFEMEHEGEYDVYERVTQAQKRDLK